MWISHDDGLYDSDEDWGENTHTAVSSQLAERPLFPLLFYVKTKKTRSREPSRVSIHTVRRKQTKRSSDFLGTIFCSTGRYGARPAPQLSLSRTRLSLSLSLSLAKACAVAQGQGTIVEERRTKKS